MSVTTWTRSGDRVALATRDGDPRFECVSAQIFQNQLAVLYARQRTDSSRLRGYCSRTMSIWAIRHSAGRGIQGFMNTPHERNVRAATAQTNDITGDPRRRNSAQTARRATLTLSPRALAQYLARPVTPKYSIAGSVASIPATDASLSDTVEAMCQQK
jgi:hypothetical protein